ncbi:hypothetical protein TA3x_004328 [Tundrisphaera sp. TA3]|uniref:hypothetical protein n=1 Tax=Tundrisphaera sp. TA3 TaxID=3435775 RepID=UPI003EBDB265
MAVRLKVKNASSHPSRGLAMLCMGCGSPLEIHQPDQAFPDRILGTCEDCHGWVVADFAPGRDDQLMLFLPGTPLAECVGLAH